MQGPRLSVDIILTMADAWRQHRGCWPKYKDAPEWRSIDNALRYGLRGLEPGSALAKLLAEKRCDRNKKGLPPLTEDTILAWADAHHQQTGHWPKLASGAIGVASGETWFNISTALREGTRGLPGGRSLARLLARGRGVRNRAQLPPLTVEVILAWADAHYQQTGS